MRDKKEEFIFDYTPYKKRAVNLDMLDGVMLNVIRAGESTFKLIIACIVMLAYGAYLAARKRLIEEEYALAKQEYEQARINDLEDQTDNDNLDVIRDDLD